MILMVRREDIVASGDGAFEVLKHQQVAGWTAVSGPHIKVSTLSRVVWNRMSLTWRKYNNVRVPAKNVLCAPGEGAAIVQMSFEASGMSRTPNPFK